jgi:4,5-DOPA dioxygenase extradiol
VVLEYSHMIAPRNSKMPVVFAGHGSPINAIEDNRWSRGFAALAGQVPRPRAILAISAHWFVDGTYVMANAKPRTIHDFGGFPRPLYEIEYPAPGHADLARRVVEMLSDDRAAPSMDWGLDHGTWSVLRWMYPAADVPVIQLSIDRRQGPQYHISVGRALAPLRAEGILILASGNIVHNLRDAAARMRSGGEETPHWARRFDDDVRQALEQHDGAALQALWPDSELGRLAHPTPDHWFPLLYAAGASDDRDPVGFSSEGFDWGSISMRNVVFG